MENKEDKLDENDKRKLSETDLDSAVLAKKLCKESLMSEEENSLNKVETNNAKLPYVASTISNTESRSSTSNSEQCLLDSHNVNVKSVDNNQTSNTLSDKSKIETAESKIENVIKIDKQSTETTKSKIENVIKIDKQSTETTESKIENVIEIDKQFTETKAGSATKENESKLHSPKPAVKSDIEKASAINEGESLLKAPEETKNLSILGSKLSDGITKENEDVSVTKVQANNDESSVMSKCNNEVDQNIKKSSVVSKSNDEIDQNIKEGTNLSIASSEDVDTNKISNITKPTNLNQNEDEMKILADDSFREETKCVKTSVSDLEIPSILESQVENIEISEVEQNVTLPHPKSEKKLSKDELTFKGTLEKISSSNQENVDASLPEISDTFVHPESDSSFQPFSKSVREINSVNLELENESDKKSEISTMEDDSNVCTPLETPCDSRDTSPTSTLMDSGQVSAVPSPIPKDSSNLMSESLMDENSMDTLDIPEQKEEEKDEKSTRRPVRRKKKSLIIRKRGGRGRSVPVVMDEETRMSAANGGSELPDEDSQSSTGTVSRRESKKYRSEVINPESTEAFTAEKVVEYLWPLEGLGEHYFIQEHISQYLGIMSFKRKYPDLRRRPIESQEKEFLKDLKLVTEIACDLGLTAVRSEDAFDIMFSDFPSKYEELQKVLRERKEKQLKEKGKVDYQVVDLDKSKMQEYSRKAALNAARWNVSFNKDRNEDRKYSFDLQTFTLHMPSSRCVKYPASTTKVDAYPVAVLPGQYIDNCKKYGYNELRSMPLQSVILGPYTDEELVALSQGPEVESDEESGSAETCSDIKDELGVTPSVFDPMSAEKQPRCKVCSGGTARNKEGKPEGLIICGTCRTASHPTCIDLAEVMIEKMESYSWQCMDCKTCAQCSDPDDEEKMIFCDMCDRGYHIYCVGLRRVPNGRWHCKVCAACFSCGVRNPAGTDNIKNAEWQHEYRKDKHNKELRYMCTLCMPCDKYWKRRQYCTVCIRVYRSIPDDGMVRCAACPKYVHREKCSILLDNERYCGACSKNRNKSSLNHSRIIAAAKRKMATGNMWK